MNYIVFDLEFNQAWDCDENINSKSIKCPFEIIQIGALKLDEKLQLISSFNKLIKPDIYNSLHPYVKQITGISSDLLACAQKFKVIYNDFIQFIGDDSILCVWGASDLKELMRNIRYHNLDSTKVPIEYINIQAYASKYLHCPKGTSIGLRNAVELLNIPVESNFHDAYNDAYFTAEVFKIINNPSIKTAFYHSNYDRRLNNQIKKTSLDTYSLLKQFEKMYNRQMSEEEQSIIKLAYLMGRTHQFQKNN